MTQGGAAALLVFIALIVGCVWGCLLSERKWRVSRLEMGAFVFTMFALVSPGLSLLFIKAVLG